ncbi:GntR family transcriptional regulator/MocR family aminotransferase [Methylosinus sp. sav-2]|nr:GntR family transcriptional regulator/MocR family aminotransferase [Methylosinus sp. sav-2]
MNDMGPIFEFVVDRSDRESVYRQIYERIRLAILSGSLAVGAKLPSSRALAGQLNIARGTVDTAYRLLSGEGYVVCRGAGGTIVSPLATVANASSNRADAGKTEWTDAFDGAASSPLPFQMGLPAVDVFPRALWSRLCARRARRIHAASMVYPDIAGLPALRYAISAYLGISRGIACSPGQVIITGGYQAALHLIAEMMMRPGDKIWFEDPGYHKARQLLEGMGASIVPVPVDNDGMRVEDAIKIAPNARFALVTPAHQSPLSVSLSFARRGALLAWAARQRAWIIEDDYDSEFRYVGQPLPALKSADREDRVIYTGTFSKVLFPSLRLGYLVAPDELVGPFLRSISLNDAGRSPLEQAVVADFLTEGHFARHLHRMRSLYASRRAALARALEIVFEDRISVDLQMGGLHIIIRFGPSFDDVAAAEACAHKGLSVVALSSLSLTRASDRGLLIAFANVPETSALSASRRLENALSDLPPIGIERAAPQEAN